MKGQLRLMQVGFLSLLILPGVQCADLNCQCVISNSRYVTVETPLTTATTMGKTTMTDEMSTTAGGGGTATASPPTEAAVIRMNTSSQLTAAFTELAFNQSTPGFEFDNATNRFALSGREGLVAIDLLIGPSGVPCRSMPAIEQICVSSVCATCNLLQYSSAAAISGVTASELSQRIVFSGFVDRSTDCVGRSQFERYGDFRYLVVIPKKAPDPGKPYAFTLSISGNFSAYSCPTSRKRRGVAVNIDRMILRTISRVRRETSSGCICPPGQDPVFSNSRIVLIAWVFILKPFDSALEDSSSEAYMVFARESYYLLIDSVRKPVTNLTSAVGDFFGITFTAEGSGTKLDGKLVVRSAAEVSNEFLRDQLTLILPGVGWSIVGLKIRSESSSDSSTPKPSFPVYAAVLISILSLLVLATVLILVLWRLKVIGGPPPRRLAYQASAGVESASSGVNSSEAIDISKWRLGSTLEAVVQMPETACHNYYGPTPATGAPANDLVSDDKDNFSKIAGDDNGV
ncbi:hypothetical protein BOX15_Mlig005394g1 [Macrostomum lignano]|uniref:Protein kinase domain-containing protein n=2 Tax=Macrostomum lignano TaxID=282301 RepID=A0A1I8GBY2_9PLAT|nr:hypothetical protein BOX15_Mlig005394g1 [Macrostomum lignano]